MTDPAWSTTRPGRQPLADQPTEVVPLDRFEVPEQGGDRYVEGYAPDDDRYDQQYDQQDDDRYDDDSGTDVLDDSGWTPDYSTAPVVVRRADVLAGLLLLVAGMAAGVSLLVVWVHGGATGLELVGDGLTDAGRPALADSWPALAVVGGGIVLFVLGLLAYVPAKTHRFLGALALLVSLVVAAGVLVPLADANWALTRWAVGAWFTAAVGALGLLGALKALSTGPRRG